MASSGAVRRTVTASPTQRAASSAAGIGDDARRAQSIKRGHGGPPGRRRASAVTAASRPSMTTRSGCGGRRCQPSMSVRPSSGECQLPVTLPMTSPLASKIGVPSTGAGPSIVNPTQRRSSASFAVRSSAARPMNRGLSIRAAQSMPEAARRRVELGVHADDHVALLEPQPEQRLEAVRRDAEVLPGVEERAPQLDGTIDRVVQLPGRLAGERQAHDVAVDPGDRRPDMAKEAGRLGEAEATEQLPGERPRDVDRGEGHRPVHDVDAEAPRIDPVAQPHLGVGGATARERQREPRLRVAQDHPVVHDVAALVEQQRVSRPADLDIRDVARVDALERLDDVRPADDELAERADVADRHALADRPVLADRVAVVPRPPPAAEPIHPTRRARGAPRGAASAGTRRPSCPRRPRRG